MRTRIISLLAILIVVATGCSDSTAPTPPSIAGTWSGNLDGMAVSFTATENAQNVTGNGHLAFGSQSYAVTISGTHNHPEVALTLRVTGFQDMAFSGAFTSALQVSGRINGSGFNNVQFRLDRQ